jgi:uroporphyrinogen decarboxylase
MTQAAVELTMRERVLHILRYEDYDWMPVVHFGFWDELYDKWEAEGRIPCDAARKELGRGSGEIMVAEKLGFDIGWGCAASTCCGLRPGFEREIIRSFPDGSRHVRQGDGVTVLDHPGVLSIPSEIDHLLTDRASWEQHYLPRLQWTPERIDEATVSTPDGRLRMDAGGLDYLRRDEREELAGVDVGSIIGFARNWLGIEGLSYMLADDPDLVREIIDTIGGLSLRGIEDFLGRSAKVDHLHFWEDICFNNGPLVNPAFFREICAPWYRKITDAARRHGVDLVSVDCDGWIDSLVPIWLENGVNIMFPIEVGTWAASIRPWREKYGRQIRGVGGMDKRVFAIGRPAIDAEIERLKPLVELGGYIPCPDHRIPLEAEWDLVRYYCDRMREAFAR